MGICEGVAVSKHTGEVLTNDYADFNRRDAERAEKRREQIIDGEAPRTFGGKMDRIIGNSELA